MITMNSRFVVQPAVLAAIAIVSAIVSTGAQQNPFLGRWNLTGTTKKCGTARSRSPRSRTRGGRDDPPQRMRAPPLTSTVRNLSSASAGLKGIASATYRAHAGSMSMARSTCVSARSRRLAVT